MEIKVLLFQKKPQHFIELSVVYFNSIYHVLISESGYYCSYHRTQFPVVYMETKEYLPPSKLS